jgi:hypothetical protein
VRPVAARMDHPLGDALVVEVEDLLAESENPRAAGGGPRGADLEGVLIVGDGHALLGGEDVLRRLEPLVEGDRTITIVDGFAGWFATGEQAPPRWKQATAVLLALFPVTLTLGFLQRTFAADVPWVPALFVSNIIGISLLTWVLMPRITGMLHGWLHR